MSKEVQIRRGTADQHLDFTGKIGEITMDTTNNTLRVHDGETVGGTVLAKQETLDAADYIIETQMPSASNNYTWFRKYKSGWVEQGGRYNGSATVGTITLPIKMADNAYSVVLSRIVLATSDDQASISLQARNVSTTSFQIRQTYAASNTCGLGSGGSYASNWIVRGMMEI